MKNSLQLNFATSILRLTCLRSMLVFIFLAASFVELQAQKPVLKHSYTFDEGTADDRIGEAHGIINGGKIINGEYVSFSQGQYINLPADKININTYKSLTLEAYLLAGSINAYYTMFSYFGDSNNSLGTNYLFQSLCNAGHSATAISCKNTETPWAVCTNVYSNEVKDLKYHHMISTFDNHEIKFYIDGILVNSNTIDEFPNNVISNISNKLAYLGASGYKSDPTWYGAIDEFNIYEGIMDPASIKKSADKYLKGKKEVAEPVKEILSNVLVNPGFKPECDLSDAFIKSYKQSKFIIYPTVVRTPDSTAWSATSAKAFSESLISDLKLNAEFNNFILDPGELKGQGQFAFFNNDMQQMGRLIKEKNMETDYNMVLEILFPPQNSPRLNVFGIHILVLDNNGENAFSFLLNSHHDYFFFNNLFVENSTPESVEELNLKCARVAGEALARQIEYAENGVPE